jgi:hypothetical protein
MALARTIYKNGVKALLQQMFNNTSVTNAEVQENFAEGLTALTEAFIKSGTVTVASGIALSSTGNAAQHYGTTVANGTGTIS